MNESLTNHNPCTFLRMWALKEGLEYARQEQVEQERTYLPAWLVGPEYRAAIGSSYLPGEVDKLILNDD